MNFELTEDQILLRDMIRGFAQDEISPKVKALEDKHEFPQELLQKLGELGILGMSVPAEYGGTKTDNLSLAIAIEELSRVFPSLAVIVSVHSSLFCYAINQFGTEAQKKKYLSKAASGKIIGAFSLTEPGAGSDATNLKTKSRKEGDGYVLNGTKNWVTTGYNAGAIILITVSETSTEDKKRLNAFIVDSDTPGLQVSKIEEKMGLHASPTAELVLEECWIPAENLLGGEGNGISIAFQCLDSSRIGIAAQAVGLSQRALDEAVKYAKNREAFGGQISDLQAIQLMIADMSTQTEQNRIHVTPNPWRLRLF